MNSGVLKENKDFRRLYHRGKSSAEPALVSYVMRSNRGECRVGITTSKKIGNAVRRNRARRVIRAAYAELSPRIVGCWDIVFVARSKTTFCKMQQVKIAMEKQLLKAGVIE